ncbi:MAG: C25 family cysteine peptidase [Acidobacteriota bacterium]
MKTKTLRLCFQKLATPVCVLMLAGCLAVFVPAGREKEVQAARTPTPAQLITVRDSNAILDNGDYVGCSASPGLNTYYSVFIEVPSGTPRLTIDFFDADYGSIGGPPASNLYDFPSSPVTQTEFTLLRPDGTSVPLNTSLSDPDLNFDRGNNSAVGTNGPDTRAANGQWKNFYTTASPAAGHWELRIVQPGGGNSGVNPFGVAAHTLDPGSNRDQNLGGPTTGRGLNMYWDPGIHLGPQTPGRTPPITWNYYPYITNGCTCRANDFDWDSASGTIQFTSPTGSYTFSTTAVSGSTVWLSRVVGPWTNNFNATDYGIWQNNLTIGGFANNHITYYIGDYSAPIPSTTPPQQPTPANWRSGDKFRVYFPGAAGATTAPLKPYMIQRLIYIGHAGNGPNPPCVGQTTFYRVRVDIVNPTDYSIVLDGSTIGSRTREVVANVPSVAGISYTNDTTYGGAQATQGVIVLEPADSATSGSIVWRPGTISANSGASLFYVIRVAPTAASPCIMDVTGSPGGTVEGTTATWLDETGNPGQERATYTFGPLCQLAVDRSGACPGCSGSAPPTPTKVDLVSFEAKRHATGDVLVQWVTGYESAHLGFHLWRERDGRRERLTPELIAGSALLTGDALTAGQHYAWRDEAVRWTKGSATYWLEAYDLDGSRQWYGPIELRTTREALPLAEMKNSPLLGHLATRVGRQIEDDGTPAATDRAGKLAVSSRNKALKDQGDLAMQQWLAAQPAVKLRVTKTGWQRVSFAELAAAGLPPTSHREQWQLYVHGRQTPLRMTSEGIEFYGVAGDTPESGEQVYWLIEGKTPGQRIATGLSGPALRPMLQSFRSQVTRADKTTYFAALLNGDEDNFFGSVVTNSPLAQEIVVRDPALAADEPAQVSVTLQGVSLGTHAVAVAWNGQPLGTVTYSGRAAGQATWTVPAEQVLNGVNTVTLQAQEAGDVSLVKALTVNYSRQLRAADDRLLVHVPPGNGRHALHVAGFGTPARAFDVTQPEAPVELPVRMVGQTAMLTAAAGQKVLLTTTAAMWSPQVEANVPSAWHRADMAADFVILTHGLFRPAAERLAWMRRAEGLQTVVVDVADVYDEWSYGSPSTAALRAFLETAAASWARPARYALLVGNATFDPRDYLGFGGHFIPTKLLAVGTLETAVDDWFGDFAQTGLAQLAIGRLPVKTLAEAEIAIGKILAYEQAGAAPWKQQVVVVADDPDTGGDFDRAAADVVSLAPDPTRVTLIRLSVLGAANARAAVLAGVNAGAGLVNYVGHGSTQNWAAEQLLTSADAATLTNHMQPAIIVGMTCLNGFHHDLYTTSLGKALVLSPGGAVATWSSSSLTPVVGQHGANLALLDALYGLEPAARLGEAIRRAKAATNSLEVQQSWTLLGDPTLRLRDVPRR